MEGLASTAAAALGCLDRAGLDACVIGGLAVQRWGEPRATQDVDLTVLAPIGDEDRPIDVLLASFRARRPDARSFAKMYRVLLLEHSNGIPIDVNLAALPFEREVLARAVEWVVAPEVRLRVCTAEDLVIYKLLAARPRDVVDVEGIVRLRHQTLDVGRIREHMATLSRDLEAPELIDPFERALRRVRPG